MDGNEFDALGGAMSGASLGGEIGSIVPGVGTAIGTGVGALAGGLYGLFSKKKKPQLYSDPNRGLIDGQIYQLLNSHLGLDLGNRAASRAQRQTKLMMESIGNRPGMTNTAALGELYDDAQRRGEGATVDAQLSGAQYDQQARAQAIGLAQQQSAHDFQITQYNQSLSDRQTPLETIGLQGLGMMVGNTLTGGGSNGGGNGNGSGTGSDAPFSETHPKPTLSMNAPPPPQLNPSGGGGRPQVYSMFDDPMMRSAYGF